MLESKAVIPDENRVDGIVSEIVESLNDVQKIDMLMTARQEMFVYHHGLGRAIRNRYKLWQDKALLAEIGEEHPDDASSAIIRSVWDKLRETEAEALGFCDAPCVDCGETVLVAFDSETYNALCYDCEKRDQAYDPHMEEGE